MNGSNTYKERQSVKNIAEFLFEYYCAEKNYQLIRVGFDEKNKNIDNFFRLNTFLRNLPDYIVNTNDKTLVVNVKVTANLKEKEYRLIPNFMELYGSKEAQLVYAFCFLGENPKMLYPEKVINLYDQSKDKAWSDGVVYRTLSL